MIKTKTQILEYLFDKKDDSLFEIIEKQEKSLRSIAQNKYYFGVIVKMISDYHGYSPVETHELLKLTLNIETTTDLDTKDFKFTCELIRDLWNTKFSFYIPKPNEVEDLRILEKYLF